MMGKGRSIRKVRGAVVAENEVVLAVLEMVAIVEKCHLSIANDDRFTHG